CDSSVKISCHNYLFHPRMYHTYVIYPAHNRGNMKRSGHSSQICHIIHKSDDPAERLVQGAGALYTLIDSAEKCAANARFFQFTQSSHRGAAWRGHTVAQAAGVTL